MIRKSIIKTSWPIHLLIICLPLFVFSKDNKFNWTQLQAGPLETVWIDELSDGLSISKNKLQSLMQQFHAEAYGVGFLYFGHLADAGHAHLIEDENGHQKALLLHTQEVPERFSDADLKSLKSNKRSWIIWLDKREGKTIELAINYQIDSSDNFKGLPYSRRKPEEDWLALNEAYTVHSLMLDPVKMGFPFYENPNKPIYFHRVVCQDIKPANNNIITLKQDMENICVTVNIGLSEEQLQYEDLHLGSLLAGPKISL